MPANIQFDWDRPVTLRIADPDRDCQRYDEDLRCGHYQTVDGIPFRLPRPAVIVLNALEVQPGEEIGICRRRANGRHNITKWDIWLTPRSEKARATAETGLESSEVPTDTELLLEASLKRQDARNRQTASVQPIRKEPAKESVPVQPRLFDRGTGTDGPAPAPQLRPAIRRGVPYGDVLRHVIRTVKTALESENVQLGDGPTQDLISTLYIDCARRSGVDYDFTREVER